MIILRRIIEGVCIAAALLAGGAYVVWHAITPLPMPAHLRVTFPLPAAPLKQPLAQIAPAEPALPVEEPVELVASAPDEIQTAAPSPEDGDENFEAASPPEPTSDPANVLADVEQAQTLSEETAPIEQEEPPQTTSEVPGSILAARPPAQKPVDLLPPRAPEPSTDARPSSEATDQPHPRPATPTPPTPQSILKGARLNPSASLDNSVMQLELGAQMFEMRQYAQARYWFERASESNLPEAMYNLGQMARQGLAGQPNMIEAERWYREAARLGEPLSMMNLALIILANNPDPEPHIRSEAISLLRQAAEAGAAEAEQVLRGLEAGSLDFGEFRAQN